MNVSSVGSRSLSTDAFVQKFGIASVFQSRCVSLFLSIVLTVLTAEHWCAEKAWLVLEIE